MKAKLVPVYFQSAQDPDFIDQLGFIKELLQNEAEVLEPVALSHQIPDSDGVIFPQMLGDAYRRLEDIKKLPQPLMVVTSEFGTVSMWDWEINSYLATKGIGVVAPNTLEKAKLVCRAFALKRQLHKYKFLVYQDKPASGGGNQDEIFKRFYWWEDECTNAIDKQFGLKIIKKSFKKLAEEARNIPDTAAQEVWDAKKDKTPIGALSKEAILGAVKLYMMVKRDLDKNPDIIAAGMNCLNESHFCDTTPCLAWNWLYEERGLIWGCEGDTVSMLTKALISKTLGVPFMMTNMYPFLMGQAATKHEHIPGFPSVTGKPENHILAAHCGYFGVVPQSFSTEWKLEEKVLTIVHDDATSIDARIPEGPITLVKLMPPFNRWSVIEGNLNEYAQFENSHCLNSAVIEVENGPKMIDELVSHHYIVTTGHNLNALELVSKVLGLECETLN